MSHQVFLILQSSGNVMKAALNAATVVGDDGIYSTKEVSVFSLCVMNSVRTCMLKISKRLINLIRIHNQ